MTWLKRILTWTIKLLGALTAAALTIVIVAVLVAGFSRSGSSFLFARIAELASTENTQIEVTGASPLFSNPLTIEQVTLADTRGTYATIGGLSLDWTPSDLFRKRFSAELISAANVDVTRAPEPTAEEKPASDEPFQLPIDIDVRKVDLPSVQLGAALAKRDLSLSAQGAVQIDGDTIASRLTATRRDDPGNSVVAALLYAPNENQLRIRLDYQEPAAGLLGQVLQLPGEPPLAINIDGAGPLNDWAGKITAELSGEQTVSVDARHQLAEDGTRTISASGGGNFASLMPPELRAIFAGQTAIDADIAFGTNGTVTVNTGTLTTASAIVTGAGRYDPDGNNDLRLEARATGEPVLLTAPGRDIPGEMRLRKATVSLRGPADAAALSADLDLASLTLPQGSISDVNLKATSNAFDLATRQGPMLVDLTVQSADVNDPRIKPYVRAPLRLTAPLTIAADTISIEKMAFDSDGLDGTVSGLYSLENQGFSGEMQLTAEPGLMPAAIASKLNRPVTFSTRLDYAAPQAISLRNIDLQTNLGQVQGSLSLDPQGALATDLTGQLNDLGSFVDRIQGAANFDLSASGPLDAIEATVNLAVEQGIAAGYKVSGLTLTAQGLASPTAPQGDISISGQIDGKPVQATGKVVSADGLTQVEGLALEIGPNTAKGALSLGADFKPSGEIDFDFPDISLLAALAGQNVGGDLKGTVALASNAGKTSAVIKASGTKITREGVLIDRPAINLNATDIAALAVEGKVTADAVTAGANRIEGIDLKIDRADDTTQFNLSAQYDKAPVNLRGSLSQTPNGMAVVLDALQAAPRGIALSLSKPTTIRIDNGTVTLPPTTIAAGSGRVTVSGDIGERLNLQADIAGLPASLANAFAPQITPEGSISGRVDISGTTAAPVVDYRLDWQGATIAQSRAAGLAPLSLTANGRFENQRLTLDSRVNGAGIGLGGTGTVSLTNGVDLELRIEGDVPLNAINDRLAAQGLVANGTARVNLTVGGSSAEPSITGTIVTSGARVVDVRRNLAVEQIATTINLTGSRAEIGSLTGNFATGGRVTASGSIDIRSAGLPADLAINLDKAVYVDGNTVTSTADARLTLKGPLLAGPTLAGTVNLSRTSITLSESKPASLRELDIQHRNAPADVLRQQSEQDPAEGRQSNSPIVLDLTIASPTQTFVRGRGIDAELGGTIKLTGTAAAPSVSGAFELRRGRMQILTKRLTITQATITFGGDLVPLIDLEATTTSGGATITIKLTGLASNPSVTFGSSPALPQDEILAQLIFGQSMARLSPLQIAQLADAAAQLAGGRGTSLFQSLRTSLGIDDLDVSTDETGQTSISAGKYLNDRTYLELRQSGNGGAKAVINLDIGRGVKLKGEAGGEGAGGGIFYEKEY
ncbi:translocation/assembly module TamB domain-containing protein [Rhizobium sp. AG855]|uniref:translocation/assembly module TamB domain-containing protein n=1 Tax=Rhizobium sp. AG855 TaxID=2183898 RepID=UPI000E71BC10|nr:translocation/assembly module TamB domain-containing protein [Rhizobium sp. AG855]RKE80177.1 autotransporter secretion inner membrane protein TamB [Rhizobium sp. AG855]